MKLLTCCLALALISVGCGGSQTASSNTNSIAPTTTKVSETPAPQSPTPTPASSPATTGGERPVEFTYLGPSSDKESLAFKIKVNTAKPISQVDIGVKYMAAGGSVLEETTYAWQNIVKSARKPIGKGQTYEGNIYLSEGATKAECVLKRVIFEDGTHWSAE
ncbi:MAG TPA: hypothetical protein VJT09_02795 [Pyrinomonadaceae bacterium]|nr:hypothetical protein [Pyrinomonadaceae bacterium]